MPCKKMQILNMLCDRRHKDCLSFQKLKFAIQDPRKLLAFENMQWSRLLKCSSWTNVKQNQVRAFQKHKITSTKSETRQCCDGENVKSNENCISRILEN